MQQTLTYFTDDWMPSPSNLPAHCQIAGMTPVRPTDDKVASEIVRGAFQSPDETSIFALLAVSARRMRAVHNKAVHPANLPDLYSVRAIQALRRAINAGSKASVRTVLDMAFSIIV